MDTPSYVNQAKEKVVKNAPFVFGRFLQMLGHSVFVLVRLLGQILRDAIGR
jgi:hypothetical protein